MLLSPRDKLLFSIALQQPAINALDIPIVEELLPPWLRDFQFQMLSQAAALFRQGYRRVLLQSPTGSGKTKMAEAALLSALGQGMTAEFLVHRKELLKQTSETFAALPHSFIAAGFDYDPVTPLHLAGVQTLIRRLGDALPKNLIIIDEAHHATSDTYLDILAAYPDAYFLLLTATPERLDGRGLDEVADVMVLGPPPRWLIDQGYLAEYDYYAPDIPDMTGVASTAGEFSRDAAAEVVDKPKLVGSIVEHYLRLANGYQGIVFAQNRKHSKHIADEFNANGVPAMHVDGTMDNERDYFDQAFRAGDLRIGVNVALFGEGYDVPNIRYVGIGAATKSLVNHLQWCGRALRPPDSAVICDHAGNAVARQLGLPDDERNWSLEGRAARRATGGCNDDAIPIRQCLVCFRVSPSTVRICPGCGTEAPTQERKIATVAGQLTKLEREARRAEEKEARRKEAAKRKREEQACKSHSDFVKLAVSRGIDNADGWARMKIKLRAEYVQRFRRR